MSSLGSIIFTAIRTGHILKKNAERNSKEATKESPA